MSNIDALIDAIKKDVTDEQAKELLETLRRNTIERNREVVTCTLNELDNDTEFDPAKSCLFCGNAMSADAIDGSQVLVCFSMKGHEHIEMQVDDMYSCDNFN